MSVRKRKWLDADGEEQIKWVCDYKDAGGKRRLKTFKTKKEADKFASQADVEVRAGTHVADSQTVTVAAAAETWVKRLKLSDLRRSSIEDYERTAKLHIVPFMGTLKLNALNVPRLRAYEDELREAGRTAFTIRRTMLTLGVMLSDAQERGLIAVNAVRDLSRSRKRTGKAQAPAKRRLKIGTDIPTLDEIKALLAALDDRWKPLIMTAVFSGLRASELRGLRHEDVDFTKGTIRVHQRADRYRVIGETKSVSGERVLPVSPQVISVLREWRLRCPKADTGKRDADGKAIMALDLVFPNSRGKPESLDAILVRGLHPAWVAAGVTVDTGKVDDDGNAIMGPKYTGLHSLRHFYASWLINRKADGGLELPAKTVQARLGHASPALTLSVYSHLFPTGDDGSELEEAAAFLLS